MKILKKVSIFFALILAIAVVIFFNYVTIKHYILAQFLVQTKKEIQNELESKKSSTLAIAITMSECKRLRDFIEGVGPRPPCLEELPRKFRTYTHYKNIKVELLDRAKKVIYRSWTSNVGQRESIPIVAENFSDFLANSEGFFIYSLASVKKQKRVVGYLLLLSHFNSIRKNLSKLGVDVNVVLNPLLYDGALKVVDSVKRLDEELLRKILRSRSFLLSEGVIYSKFPIHDLRGRDLGWIIFYAPEQVVLSRFFNQTIFIRIFILLLFVGVALFLVYFFYTKEKEHALRRQANYFYRIFDTLQEMVVVTDGQHLVYVNRKFFDYFYDYSSIEEFFAKHECICDFFVPEEGFLAPVMEGKRWTQYLIENEGKNFKVKMAYKGHIYIFLVKANKISEHEYSVIFSDITEEYIHSQQLQKMAIKDALTGVYNRYLFDKIAHEKMEESVIFGSELLFIMIDIDHFKQINDTYGHERGDIVLMEVAKLITQAFRSNDPVIRIGGEEFLVIVETKDVERILSIVEDLKYEIEHHRFDGIDRKVTVSIGIARYNRKEDIHSLYKRADEALYESKRNGRNKITYKD